MKFIFLTFVSLAVAIPLSSFNDNQAPLQNGQTGEKYLIELGPDVTRWVTEDEKWILRRVSYTRPTAVD